jgi:hypothetical protein
MAQQSLSSGHCGLYFFNCGHFLGQIHCAQAGALIGQCDPHIAQNFEGVFFPWIARCIEGAFAILCSFEKIGLSKHDVPTN